MTPEDVAAIAEAFKAAVREALESAQALPPKLMFDVAEASEITGLPKTWLYRESEEGRIPSRKVGGYRKFSLADLEAIVAAHEVKPTSGLMARHVRAQSGRQRAA